MNRYTAHLIAGGAPVIVHADTVTSSMGRLLFETWNRGRVAELESTSVRMLFWDAPPGAAVLPGNSHGR